MTEDPCVDRPRPRFPWWIWLWVVGFSIFFVFWPMTWSGAGPFPWLLIAVPGIAFVWGYYFTVRYELSDHSLTATVMFFGRVTVSLDEIDEVQLLPSAWSFFHPRNFGSAVVLNRWSPMLRIVSPGGRKLLITPTNPEEFRDEILRRRDAARSNSR